MQAAGKQVSLPVFRVLERDQMKWTGHRARKGERGGGPRERRATDTGKKRDRGREEITENANNNYSPPLDNYRASQPTTPAKTDRTTDQPCVHNKSNGGGVASSRRIVAPPFVVSWPSSCFPALNSSLYIQDDDNSQQRPLLSLLSARIEGI